MTARKNFSHLPADPASGQVPGSPFSTGHDEGSITVRPASGGGLSAG